MKQMKKEVESLTKELKSLTQKTKKIVKALEQLEKDQIKSKAVKPKKSVKKPAVKKTAKKPTTSKVARGSVTDAIMGVIQANSEGVSTDQIMEQTGLNKIQVWGTINRAKKEGKVKTVKRGIYVGM